MNLPFSPENTWALIAVIAVGTGIAIWLEQTYKWAAKISGPVIALVMAMILSNVGVMPTESPCYDFINDCTYSCSPSACPPTCGRWSATCRCCSSSA